MSDVKNSIVTSISNYLYNLQYLARVSNATQANIMLLIIADDIYDWANWAGASQTDINKLKSFRKCIIQKDTKIVDVVKRTNDFYKNVNTPQTIYTWQRVYDNFDAITVNDPSGIIPGPYTPPYFWGKLNDSSKPPKNQQLINSGEMVYGDPSLDLRITYNSTNEDFLWFAIPQTIPSKNIWWVDSLNTGNIGGSRNLFDTETIVTIRVPQTLLDINYKIYVTNYSTAVDSIYLAESFGQIPG